MPDTRRDPTALLIVSPHLDDAVLSCFALLTGPAPADVLTVFAGAPVPPRVAWSERAMGFADSDATMTARRTEDARALEGLARATDTMDLLDEDYIDDRRTPADAHALRKRVSSWLAGNPGGRVTVPAGAGRVLGRIGARVERILGDRGQVTQHPDHVFVRDAVAELVRRGELEELLLYEELPYLWHGEAAAESRRVAQRTSAVLTQLELRVDRDAKASRIARYASQLGHLTLDGRSPADPAALPEVERYALLTTRAAIR
jgi:LmbE family N-acetylglucosaminyl deacetylase